MEIFELLIESGGFDTLCLKTSEGCTPLHLAVIWSFHEATRFHRDTATSLTAGRDKKKSLAWAAANESVERQLVPKGPVLMAAPIRKIVELDDQE